MSQPDGPQLETQAADGELAPAWRALLAVADFICERPNAALQAAWHDARELYIGPSGFVERHRMKVHGYLELGFEPGHDTTVSRPADAFTQRASNPLDDALRDARADPSPSRS